MALVRDPDNIRLALLGSSVGNGHPYSWAAIFNGYDRELMTAECPFPGIPAYLNQQPAEAYPLGHALVTHVHCAGDGGFAAEHVAACSLIPTVVRRPEDVIGEVDAVVIATDRGSEHVARCRPFVEAGLPIFVDKPLVNDLDDLRTFVGWVRDGHAIMSSSSMRYAKEFLPYRLSTRELGDLRLVTITSPKSWEAYGIHALEAVYPILGAGFDTVRNTGSDGRDVVHLTHRSGADVLAVVNADMYGSFGHLQLCGTQAAVQTRFADTFYAFRAQLAAFVDYLRSGERPFGFDETVELMKLVIAGTISREQDGRLVRLAELDV